MDSERVCGGVLMLSLVPFYVVLFAFGVVTPLTMAAYGCKAELLNFTKFMAFFPIGFGIGEAII